MSNFVFHILHDRGTRAVAAAALACLVFAAASCRTIERVEVPVYIHDTTRVVDHVHDSVFVENTVTEYEKGDTVFVERTKTVYVEKTVTDTVVNYVEKPVEVTNEVTKYVEKELAWWQKSLMFLGVLLIVGIVGFIACLFIKTR